MQSQAACEAAACAEAAGEKLRGRLQASQKEVQSLKERLSSLLAERKQQQCVQQLQACQLWFLKIVTVCSASLAGQLATLKTNRIINLFACCLETALASDATCTVLSSCLLFLASNACNTGHLTPHFHISGRIKPGARSAEGSAF